MPGRLPAGPPRTCGTVVEPGVFDGSAVVSGSALTAGPPPSGPPPGFTVKITANPGTYAFHCRVHPTMIGTLTVVAAGAPATTVADAAAASASQAAALVAAGTSVEAANSAALVRTNPN